jgi:hypothetical protein
MLLQYRGDLFCCRLIWHGEITGSFLALEGAGELDMVVRYSQHVLDRYFSRFGWAAAEVRRRPAR